MLENALIRSSRISEPSDIPLTVLKQHPRQPQREEQGASRMPSEGTGPSGARESSPNSSMSPGLSAAS